MADTSKVNIKSLPTVTEVKIGDYLILETLEGTRLLDFDDFVITEYNTTFYSAVSTNDLNIATNTSNIAALSSALSGASTSIRIHPTVVSVSGLGIGTHSPDEELHIKSTAGTVALIESSGLNGSMIKFKNSLKEWNIYQGGGIASRLDISQDSGISMSFTPNGNIGIGTVWPAEVLHLSGADGSIASKVETSLATGTPRLKIANGTREYSLKIDGDNSSYLTLFDETNGLKSIVVDDGGNVGIGTNPITNLHIGTVSACATFDEHLGTPDNPEVSSQIRMYTREGNLVVQYNDSGTTRYKFLNLKSTGTAWVHDTTAPAPGITHSPSFSASGVSFVDGAIKTLERSSDPAKPAEGECVTWLSDGTGQGGDGDVMCASTVGGVTKFTKLHNYSDGTTWS